jgi:hypothetical protein
VGLKIYRQQIIQESAGAIVINYRVAQEPTQATRKDLEDIVYRTFTTLLGTNVSLTLNCGPNVVMEQENLSKFKIFINRNKSHGQQAKG